MTLAQLKYVIAVANESWWLNPEWDDFYDLQFKWFKKKEVIEINTAERIGYIDDIELDTETSEILSVIIFGRRGRFLFEKEPDLVIDCKKIRVIGHEVILVDLNEKSR